MQIESNDRDISKQEEHRAAVLEAEASRLRGEQTYSMEDVRIMLKEKYHLMSTETYEQLAGKYEPYTMLEKSLEEVETGEGRPMDEVFDSIEQRLYEE